MRTKLTIFAIGSSLLLIGCSEGHQHRSAYGSSGYAGTSGNAMYAYVYYPDAEVYYQPQHRVYYWSEGGAWRSGAHVPQNIVLRSSVRVNLNTPEPYKDHDQVRAKYPHQEQEEGHKHQDHDQQ
jgi:hypothetical protein